MCRVGRAYYDRTNITHPIQGDKRQALLFLCQSLSSDHRHGAQWLLQPKNGQVQRLAGQSPSNISRRLQLTIALDWDWQKRHRQDCVRKALCTAWVFTHIFWTRKHLIHLLDCHECRSYVNEIAKHTRLYRYHCHVFQNARESQE